MASPVKEIVSAQYAPSSATALYVSATGVTTRIDKLSVTNITSAPAQITIYLAPSGTALGASNTTTSAQTVLPGQTWNSPNEYGQYLNPGDSLGFLASAASALVVAVGATQFS